MQELGVDWLLQFAWSGDDWLAELRAAIGLGALTNTPARAVRSVRLQP